MCLAWPTSRMVDDLRDEVEALKKRGISNPFVYIDLGLRCDTPSARVRFCLCAFSKKGLTSLGVAAASGGRERLVCLLSYIFACVVHCFAGSSKNFISPALWAPAFMRLALPADAVGMWKLSAALTHMDICFRVGEEGRAKKLPYFFAVVYDQVRQRRYVWRNFISDSQVCRKHWAENARAGVVGFDINSECLAIDRDLRDRAEAVVLQWAASANAQRKVGYCGDKRPSIVFLFIRAGQ